jgi:hypothetical protein
MTKRENDAFAELEKAQEQLRENIEKGTVLAKKTQKLLKDIKDQS